MFEAQSARGSRPRRQGSASVARPRIGTTMRRRLASANSGSDPQWPAIRFARNRRSEGRRCRVEFFVHTVGRRGRESLARNPGPLVCQVVVYSELSIGEWPTNLVSRKGQCHGSISFSSGLGNRHSRHECVLVWRLQQRRCRDRRTDRPRQRRRHRREHHGRGLVVRRRR
jgi:hypothetical protein